LNEAFNHWIVHRTPFVTAKAAMTLDARIATEAGESKWITGEKARRLAMHLRRGADAILVGVNTVLADNPSLTSRGSEIKGQRSGRRTPKSEIFGAHREKPLRRVVLDSRARTPVGAQVASDDYSELTTIVVTSVAPRRRIDALARRVRVLEAPSDAHGGINLRWLMPKLGAEDVTSLLVEGGGEVNASFLEQRLVHRIAFFYAPKVVGGREAPRAVAGVGATSVAEVLKLSQIRWRRLGFDLFLTARIAG
jgi:diaminohydroxyphosphoribosylaminopyrimidine deaminase/5-amino-6-(5-phosphoribosylamino)uracil reductase